MVGFTPFLCLIDDSTVQYPKVPTEPAHEPENPQMTTASYQVMAHCGNCSVGILRVHPDGGSYGERSDFDWSCTMMISGKEAELWGAMTSPGIAGAKAIRKLLTEEFGVTEAHWERGGRWIIKRK